MGRRAGAGILVAVLTVGCTTPSAGGDRVDGGGESLHGRCRRPASYRGADPDRPRYRLWARVDPHRREVTGRLTVRFTPDLGTGRLVFRLWPNGPRLAAEGAHLDAGPVSAGGRRLAGELLAPTTLAVDLGRRLRAGETLTASLPWRLRLPGAVLDRIARTGDAVRLGSFFPLLAWEPGRGWATDPPTTALGETSSSPTADFHVTVATPPGTDVLATGRRIGPRSWRATRVRDFAVAVGPFVTERRTVMAPGPVKVTVGVTEGLGPAPAPFVDKVAAALTDLARRYGPYPWDTLSLAVMPGLGRAGIEYPTMIFQGPDSLDWATTHEVGHSWFYALVGNNQARHPWLDEGLTSWAQARADGVLDWWVEVPMPEDARGHLGKPMSFWEDREEAYFAGVYASGVDALAALGPPAAVDCALRSYVAHNAFTIATPKDLLAALTRFFPKAPARLARFGVRTGS